MPPSGSGRDRISQLLVEIRGDLTQTEAAARSGLSQGSISKAEHGQRTPPPKVAERYARALKATAAQRTELVELCRTIADLMVTRQTRIVRKGADAQRRILAVERQCHEIRSWQAEIVPGLMQSWAYTVAVIEREPDDAWAQARRARLALLDDSDRTVMQLVPEGVLRIVLGSRAVMQEQLEHLIDLSRRPNIRLGVLPHGRPVPPLPPSFHLYGDRMATNETIVGTAFLDERVDIDRHRRWFDRLDDAAVHDDDARAVMRDVLAAHLPTAAGHS